MKNLKLLLGTLALGCIPLAAQGQMVSSAISSQKTNDSPYAMFGDTTRTLDCRHSDHTSFDVPVVLDDGTSATLVFDMTNRRAKLRDEAGCVLATDTLPEHLQAIFLSVDPKATDYPHVSAYAYCMGNPMNAIAPDGRYILFINGLRPLIGARDQFSHITNGLGGMPYIYKSDVTDYWGTDLVKYYKDCYQDKHMGFTSGSSFWNSQAADRIKEGRYKGELFHSMVQSGEIKLDSNEPIRIVSHSQGAAHAVGLAEQLMSYKDAKGNGLYNIEIIEYITPHQPTSITHPKGVKGIQYSHPNDWVTAKNWYLNGGSSFGKIKNVPVFISGKGSHKVKLNLEFIKFGELYRE